MDAEDSTSTIITKKKTMRTIVDSLLKMSRKYSTSSSGSNWMLGVILERIENNLQEIIISPFEPTQFPYWKIS